VFPFRFEEKLARSAQVAPTLDTLDLHATVKALPCERITTELKALPSQES
jgi:hypothetical protein